MSNKTPREVAKATYNDMMHTTCYPPKDLHELDIFSSDRDSFLDAVETALIAYGRERYEAGIKDAAECMRRVNHAIRAEKEKG